MKTTGEIIKICKSGGKPTIDEARMAICVLSSLITFDTVFFTEGKIREDDSKPPDVMNANFAFLERHRRLCGAMDSLPEMWLGPNYNPDDPEVQRRVEVSEELFNKFAKRQ